MVTIYIILYIFIYLQEKLKFEDDEKKKIMIELNKIIDKLKILSREK